MGIDLFIFGLAAFSGLLGALSGASRQLAQLAALVVSAVFTKPLALMLAPYVTGALGGPAVLGVVAAYVIVFIGLFSLVRWVVTSVLRKMLSAGEDAEHHGADRPLGFAIGVLKVLAVAWAVTSALVFAENHVRISGNRLALSARDSVAFAVARSHNLFAYAQFAPARKFVELGQATLDPERRKELTRTEGYQALQQDPRFKSALRDPEVKRALEDGDWRSALRNDTVMGLMQDPQIVALIEQSVASLSVRAPTVAGGERSPRAERPRAETPPQDAVTPEPAPKDAKRRPRKAQEADQVKASSGVR